MEDTEWYVSPTGHEGPHREQGGHSLIIFSTGEPPGERVGMLHRFMKRCFFHVKKNRLYLSLLKMHNRLYRYSNEAKLIQDGKLPMPSECCNRGASLEP